MYLPSCFLQSLTYWLVWIVANVIVPRRWILGESAHLCGLSSLVTFVLMIIRME